MGVARRPVNLSSLVARSDIERGERPRPWTRTIVVSDGRGAEEVEGADVDVEVSLIAKRRSTEAELGFRAPILIRIRLTMSE